MNERESMDLPLVFSTEVRAALHNGEPVVALESTLISHGLPYPENRETALEMEAAVRAAGAIPATIAILNGEVVVGITPDQVEYLAAATAGTVRKCSRRDLAIATGLGLDGATTVAGTMIIAHMAGIPVFATGGIGGVHRGHPFDVSADLLELGRTPVTVVCSGAKSILDLPLTLEVLETQGVTVLGYGTDDLPAFYTRSSGLPVDIRVDSPEEVAAIMMARHGLRLTSGMLVAVPVPVADALPQEVAEAAIEKATSAADARGVTGAALSPFILGQIAELTSGQSLAANRALLRHNPVIAAEIANAVARSMANG
jgi:pseudouridylate synthase